MVDAITNNGSFSGAMANTPSQELGKEEFLQLLVAQLRHQDPLEPMQDTEFIAQMSQFSSLEQLINMNKNLTSSIDLDYMTSQSIANSMATSLLGRTVTADSDMIYLSDGDAEINFNLAGAASEVKISIYNEEGSLVNVLYDDFTAAGMNKIEWDGKSIDGLPVPQGQYRIAVEAVAADGSEISARPFMVGKATKVQYMDGAAYLLVNGAMVMLGDIVEVEA
ncbi:MAG: flagellar hook capping protein [candidate division Zixibacteria bacterium]|nr:flagellar hook capping protein [candidate division Zixibacteria bacterium]